MVEFEVDANILVDLPDSIESKFDSLAGPTRNGALRIVEFLLDSVLRRCNQMPVEGLRDDQRDAYEATVDSVLRTGQPRRVSIYTREVRVVAELRRGVPPIEVVQVDLSC